MFGHPSNKTISKYGNPCPALMQSPPSPCISLFLSISLQLAPAERRAKFIFSTVVPLRWRRGPCHATADVLGEGP
ncbi:Cationic amino acid transporter 7 chloroplastic [Dissostichus eleginoides]|uniref:Cationic amino acid transporter 7 chloroplastic n=1 Tax=Dissostichus eleginoides TaxID=100907 RepID=A0AAD9BTX5_DISEL|nr:Cationic amino acid transporter 7 chloroplastic [Dissostichus eleginoides]